MAQNRQQGTRVVRSTRRTSPLIAFSRIVYSLVSVIMVILAFRFVLRLLGANPEAPFFEFIYRISSPFVAPFEAVFPTTALDRAVFEWNSLLAIVVYGVISWGVSSLLLSMGRSSRTEVVEHVNDER